MHDFDKLTKYLLKALDFLFVCNPKSTSYGLVLGFMLCGMKGFFCTIYGALKKIADYAYVLFGVAILNIPNVIRKGSVDEEIETQMRYIQKVQRQGNFSETEKRQQWRNVVNCINEKYNEKNNNMDNSPKGNLV